MQSIFSIARLAQSAERKALNLVVVGSSSTVGVLWLPKSVLPICVKFDCDKGIWQSPTQHWNMTPRISVATMVQHRLETNNNWIVIKDVNPFHLQMKYKHK